MDEGAPAYIDVGTGQDARRIAVRMTAGEGPGVVWLGGFRSDMRGTKAQALADWAAGAGRACLRFDYSGHGESGGEFRDGTIGRWTEEALKVLELQARGPQILVGSSMGGWIALLVARALARAPRPDVSLAGVVLIAPAVDFTEALMWQAFPEAVKASILETGLWLRPSAYGDEPYPITRRLIEDGRDHLLMRGPIQVGAPVRILQGVEDPDVPWTHAMDLVTHLADDDVVITLVKDGDHRLSRPQDIERLIATVAEFDDHSRLSAT